MAKRTKPVKRARSRRPTPAGARSSRIKTVRWIECMPTVDVGTVMRAEWSPEDHTHVVFDPEDGEPVYLQRDDYVEVER